MLAFARWHNPQPTSGDEPHYLIIANSLIVDGDVDLRNDYLFGRYVRYLPYTIDPHVNTSEFTVGSIQWYSQHGVGLGALLYPAVVLDDTAGARAEMAALAALVLALAFLWVRRFTRDLVAAAVAVGALAVSPLFLELEGRIFPDLAAAALLLGCLLLLERPGRGGGALLALGALVGLAPWFHFKNALVFATVAAIAAVQVARADRGRVRLRRLLLLLAPVVLSGAGYETAIRSWYDSWLPTTMFPPGNDVLALDPLRGMAATLFDAARGIVPNAPALLLIAAGAPIWFRVARGPFLRLALVVGPTIVLQSTFDDWSGGFSPAGRYALQFVPALLPAAALLWTEARRAQRLPALALLALTTALAAAWFWLKPWWGYAGLRNPLLERIDGRLGVDLDRWLPAFDAQGSLVRAGRAVALWVVVGCALLAWGAMLARRAAPRPAEEVGVGAGRSASSVP